MVSTLYCVYGVRPDPEKFRAELEREGFSFDSSFLSERSWILVCLALAGCGVFGHPDESPVTAEGPDAGAYAATDNEDEALDPPSFGPLPTGVGSDTPDAANGDTSTQEEPEVLGSDFPEGLSRMLTNPLWSLHCPGNNRTLRDITVDLFSSSEGFNEVYKKGGPVIVCDSGYDEEGNLMTTAFAEYGTATIENSTYTVLLSVNEQGFYRIATLGNVVHIKWRPWIDNPASPGNPDAPKKILDPEGFKKCATFELLGNVVRVTERDPRDLENEESMIVSHYGDDAWDTLVFCLEQLHASNTSGSDVKYTAPEKEDSHDGHDHP